ncbi:hypothetical protein [Vulcaniibacterium tengchongense]|uniref:Beta-lactamase n=1 Tax=Vulcaniibacterium tengchongense TaxID=1273429 RepID=A0A3N4VA39_9GAMM|nr:hypothetical protein [Vulcaniibacterium tengchongense]RPE79876.1 hypothetical protein EDC50_1705 [Vulcaniibacterium tengchongense]
MDALDRLFLALGGALALGFAAQAHAAAPLACGEYRSTDADDQRTLVVLNEQQALVRAPERAPQRYLYQARGKRLYLYDLDDGHASEYKLERGGKQLRAQEGMDGSYRLAEAAACQPVRLPPPGECRADLAACFERDDADADALRGWCEEGMSFACVRMIDGWAPSGDEARKRSYEAEFPEPAVCKEGTRQFDAQACEQAAKEAFGQIMAKELADIAGELNSDPKPLPAARLDALPALCARDGSAAVCNKAAEALWDGGRYLPARDALQVACERGGDPQACELAAPLAGLDAAALAAKPAKALPCGAYAGNGLIGDLNFGDRGLVEAGAATVLRARIENGDIRIRHDKGGDFVLKPVAGGRLLGVDSWNRFAVYEAQGKAGRCAPPVAYKEKPLALDCPVLKEGDAEACCQRGNLHGCNSLGNQLALDGDWAGAKAQYLKLCRQGVRVGCENLRQVYSEGGDESVPEDLHKLCAKDARHVACDVLETTQWELLGFANALRQAAEELEAQEAGGDGEEDAGME